MLLPEMIHKRFPRGIGPGSPPESIAPLTNSASHPAHLQYLKSKGISKPSKALVGELSPSPPRFTSTGALHKVQDLRSKALKRIKTQ